MPNHRATLRRIHILGAAGSGKTTLTKRLAAILEVPCYDLDEVGYEGGYGQKRTVDERRTDLKMIVAQPAWITEGVYLWWTQTLFEQADTIVWLNLPWHVSMPRVLTRHIRLSWAGTNRHPGIGKLIRFLWHIRKYYTEHQPRIPKAPDDDSAFNRVTVAQYLAPYQHKVVQCHHVTDVQSFLNVIEEQAH